MKQSAPSIDQAEVERFSRHAAMWWDTRGPMASLHKFNPVRLAYIRDKAAERFGRDPKKLDCLKGIRMLDIGCGGGILSEPLARLGAQMVGADPSKENVAIASAHAKENGVDVDYRATTAEDLAAAGEKFDIVLAMEVVEHVVDVNAFVAICASMVKPGGLMFAATLNRTLKSFALGDRRRRICAALAAARHPSMGQIRHPERTRARDGARRLAGDRRTRRDLQSVRRPLAIVVGHGRELHARRRTGHQKEKAK